MRDWQGRRYWLTGATGTLGRALAAHLSRAGAHLVLSARDAGGLEEVARGLPGQSTLLPFDLADGEALARAVAGMELPDGFIHLGLPGLWREFPREGRGRRGDAVGAGLLAAMHLADALLPAMVARGSGHLVLAASALGRRGRRRAGAVGAASAGIIHLAETLRAEAQGRGVAVQLLLPGRAAGASAEATARALFEGMCGDTFRLGHPLPADWAARIGQFLPDWLWLRLAGRA